MTVKTRGILDNWIGLQNFVACISVNRAHLGGRSRRSQYISLLQSIDGSSRRATMTEKLHARSDGNLLQLVTSETYASRYIRKWIDVNGKMMQSVEWREVEPVFGHSDLKLD